MNTAPIDASSEDSRHAGYLTGTTTPVETTSRTQTLPQTPYAYVPFEALIRAKSDF